MPAIMQLNPASISSRKTMQKTTPIRMWSLVLVVILLQHPAWAEQKPNLLVIMTDQQRFDSLSAAGNTILQTPNLDRIANEGVRFENAYSPSPVCASARTSMLTGLSLDNTGVFANKDVYTPRAYKGGVSYDMLLAEAGYKTGFYGKWHSPKALVSVYNNPVIGTKIPYYRQYLDSVGIPGVKPADQYTLPEGQLRDSLSGRAYVPNSVDKRYGLSIQEILELGGIQQSDIHGALQIEAGHSSTAMDANDILNAINSLGDERFSLTVSFRAPHPPFTPTEPFASLFRPEDMTLPPNFLDDMENSPYLEANKRKSRPQYRDPGKVRQFAATYYGLIKEVDNWVGKILGKLEHYNLLDNTLIVFMSDHGEMLGSHGMTGKSIFYEESVRVPFLMRLPGAIRAGTVIGSLVSTRDIFPTIMDYLGQPVPTNLNARSLRPVIEGTESRDCVISEWRESPTVPSYMIRCGDWKLLMSRNPDSQSIDALYNLKEDPHEMNNLLFEGWPDVHAELAADLKSRLISWLKWVGSPSAEGVGNRLLPRKKADLDM